MKKKREEGHDNLERWLLTYADMITLLMLFFIVLYSMSSISKEKYREVSKALETILASGNLTIFAGPTEAGRGIIENAEKYPAGRPFPFVKRDRWNRKISVHEEIPQILIRQKVSEILKQEIQSSNLTLREDERGLVITLCSDVYFESGRARLRNEMRPTFKKVAGILKVIQNFVRIEGHTDNHLPIVETNKRGYPTNWELSSARSINILRYLTEECGVEPKQVSVVAFGETRPIEKNNTPEGRAANRRVEIVILKEKILEKSDNPEIDRPLPDEEWR